MQGSKIHDVFLMFICYGYVLLMIHITPFIKRYVSFEHASRKFLHIMIGNLMLIIPFFRWSMAPCLVASPFILVTFLASPYSPSSVIRTKLERLSNLTEEGHHLGLVLYALSYTILASFFPTRPQVIAAGVLPMAYGDSVAAIIGKQYGKQKIINEKTLEGSLSMFLVNCVGLTLVFAFFSWISTFVLSNIFLVVLGVAVVATVSEALCPEGLDNLFVPLLSAFSFIMLSGS